jgi:hypothetical protein
MKATFADFLKENPNCSKFAGNPDAIAAFDFLSQDDSIIKMIDFSEAEKPALAGCVHEIEFWFDSLPSSAIDFNDDFTRTAVGRMVKTILKPFGYEVTTQKDLTKGFKGKYFTSASCYQFNKNAPATMKIARAVVPI